MSDKIEYSRLLMKRSTVSGDVPTVPPITATTLNDFTPNDIFVGEFFLNAVDDLLWIRTDTGILPIDLSGSTGTTIPSLTQVLFQGNNTGGYDIEVSSGATITYQGLTTGSTTQYLGIDSSGNTIVTTASGGSGSSGTSGTSGAAGSSGSSGTSGTNGTSGTSGISPIGLYLPLSGGTVSGDTTFTQDFYLTNLTSGGSTTFLTLDSDTGQVYTGTLNPFVGNVQIQGQSWVNLPTTGTTTTGTTINWNDGNVQEKVLGANTTFTFVNGNAGGTYILVIKQSSGGGNTITWPGTVSWAGGAAPVMTSTADRFDVYTFIFDGNKYFSSYTQNFI